MQFDLPSEHIYNENIYDIGKYSLWVLLAKTAYPHADSVEIGRRLNIPYDLVEYTLLELAKLGVVEYERDSLLRYKRQQLSRSMRRRVFKRDSRKCRYCGAYATEIDHVCPLSRGGRNAITNLVSACVACNRKKGDKTPEEAGMSLIENGI